MQKKLHFFAFSFSSFTSGKSITASAYVGYPTKLVTVPRIQKAKQTAGVDEGAVLIGLAYMGRMTVEQAKGQQ